MCRAPILARAICGECFARDNFDLLVARGGTGQSLKSTYFVPAWLEIDYRVLATLLQQSLKVAFKLLKAVKCNTREQNGGLQFLHELFHFFIVFL